MRSIFCLVIFCLILSIQFGCGTGTGDNTAAVDAGNISNEISTGVFVDAGQALAEGKRLLETGETDKAIEILNQAVTLNPDLADAYFSLGIAYALVETRDAAAVETEVTPTPNPREKKPKEVKTNSEIAFENAVKAYKKTISANEDDHLAHFNLGRAYNKLNEDEHAAKSQRQAVKLNPEDTEYQTELGAILIKLAQYREAITPLKKALELDATNTRAEELLEDAEAGRKRIDFKTIKKDEQNTNRPADSGKNQNTQNTNSNGSVRLPRESKSPTPRPMPNKPKSSGLVSPKNTPPAVNVST